MRAHHNKIIFFSIIIFNKCLIPERVWRIKFLVANVHPLTGSHSSREQIGEQFSAQDLPNNPDSQEILQKRP